MSIMSLTGAAPTFTLEGGSEGFHVGSSPRRPVVEARRQRRGADESDDLEERSEEAFQARQSSRAAGSDKAKHAVRKGRHHEVRPGTPQLLLGREAEEEASVSEPRRPATPNPYSPKRHAVPPSGRSSSVSAPAGSGGGGVKNASLEGSVVLEDAGERLAAFKRRQAMELRHVLTFELRRLAQEERDRQRGEKASAREAAADARRSDILKAADRARVAQERSAQLKKEEVEQSAAKILERQEEAARRLEVEDSLRQKQSELAAQQRAEQVAERAAILDNRIARSVRVRRARQLRSERIAIKKAEERDAAADAARRAREAQADAKKNAAAVKAETARNAIEDARRRRESESEATRTAAELKVAELEVRAEAFRRRQKAIKERERVLRGEEASDATRQRRAAAREKVHGDAGRRAESFEIKMQREKLLAVAVEARKQEEAARRLDEKRGREEHARQATERRMKTDEERREAARRKLEESAAKAELVRSEKDRINITRAQLSWETARQRKALQGSFEALKGQSRGRISFDAIAAAVTAAAAAAAATDGDAVPSILSRAFGDDRATNADGGSTITLNSMGVGVENALARGGGSLDLALGEDLTRGGGGGGSSRDATSGEVLARGREGSRDVHVGEAPTPRGGGGGGGTRGGSLGDGETGEGGGRRSPRDGPVGGGERPNQFRPKQFRPNQFRPNQSRPIQSRPNQHRPNQSYRASRARGDWRADGARPATRAAFVTSSGGAATGGAERKRGGGGGGRKWEAQENRIDPRQPLSPALFASIGSSLSFPYGSVGSAARLGSSMAEAVVEEGRSSGGEGGGGGDVLRQGRESFGATRQDNHVDFGPEWYGTTSEVQPTSPSRPAVARISTPRKLKGGRKLLRTDDLRKRYNIRGPSPTRGPSLTAPGSRRGVKAKRQKGGVNSLANDSSRPRTTTSTGGVTVTSRVRERHRADSSGPKQAGEEEFPARKNRDGLDGGRGVGAGMSTLPPGAQDVARARYDRELLAVLEEEQAAEGAREAVLATAKARAKAAQDRAGRGSSSTERISSAVAGGGDAQTGTVTSEILNPVDRERIAQEEEQRLPEGGHSMEGSGVADEDPNLVAQEGQRAPEGGRSTEGLGVADELPAKDEINRTEQAVALAVATAEAEARRLEKELARERRAASERIMRVSGAYEEALRELSEQPYYAQGSTPNRPLG